MLVAFGTLACAQVATPVRPTDSRQGPAAVPQRTAPLTVSDLDTTAVALRRPDNIIQTEELDSLTGNYRLGVRLGAPLGGYLSTPILMTPQEYQDWSLRRAFRGYFRRKNTEAYESEGQSRFDFTDMNFDLGPAEKIFGPGGVSIRTQGSAELKMGANLRRVNNPSLAANRRSTFGFDFDEKINLSLTGRVGDKVNMNINYNTDATFDFDAQQMRLKYDGKEDEIIKLIEAGNVSMPSNSTLIRGVSSLFGIRTDLQFGRLKLQTVVSQKKSASRSVSSKGGAQTTNYEIAAVDYEENRHFWLSHYFRDNYDRWMRTLPTIASGITLKRVELWVTNKTSQTQNNRNIIALTDLGETAHLSNSHWQRATDDAWPYNRANTLYDELLQQYAAARDISMATTTLDAIDGVAGGSDYEKLQSARLLSASEYTLNTALGYVSLNFELQTDEVLAVAFEYTLGGRTYQVGEFASDLTDNTQALFVKVLKPTSTSPSMGSWPLMMRNVYALGATSTQREKFRLDIKYQNDTAGVYQTYLPEAALKGTPLLRAMGLDRLDANSRANADGQFDYVEGYTISRGRIIFPVAEPFGDNLRQWIGDDAVADRYCFDALYDSTKTVARQIAEQNKFLLTGRYKGTNGAEIDLGATNIAQGSVHVTAGGVALTENVDYRVDYSMGIVTIINQSLIDAGTKIDASVESNDVYGMQRKTMLGLNWDYQFSRNFTLGGTLQYLNEQPLTTKVSMGSEPLRNTLWGLHMDWKQEAQWLTNALNAVPFLNFTAPSQIAFSADFAQLIAGQNGSVQGGASYMDDFENTKTRYSISSPQAWMMSSVPTPFAGAHLLNDVRSGYQRALLAWYYIDPIFTRRSSSLTPAHIKSDLEQLSNHYVREVFERELYPQKTQTSYSQAASLNVLNLAYYPSERGAYNLNPDLDTDGHLTRPAENWGGMMRKMDNPDFEAQNIEYIEFWMLDPFLYSGDDPSYGGELYIDLGEVSEDVLRDGKKFYESGLPIDDDARYYAETVWGRVPTSTSVTYAFNNEGGARARQDVGLNGLNSEQERTYGAYADYLSAIQGRVSAQVFDSIAADPAGDDYHYYRGSDFDRDRVGILQRYKRINMPEGNSPDTDNSPESYETAYKTTPDVEDINQDYTLNEYEKYFQYHVSIHPSDTVVGQNYIADIRRITPTLRNGSKDRTERWFQFRIPLAEFERAVGGITDFTSIRFMRMYLTGFSKPVILRFATLDLVQADWRVYEQSLYAGGSASGGGLLEVGAVSLEENNEKLPVNYILPPGISRVTDPSNTQLMEENEQALALIAKGLTPGDARAVFKNCRYDMRQYRHLQLFVHANALASDVTDLHDGETSLFIRIGSDYRSNYYEYEVPLTLTPEGHYDRYSAADSRAVWPQANMIDIDLDKFTALKKNRNRDKSLGTASYNQEYSVYDSDSPNNRIAVMGNPTLGEVKTIMIGVRNNSRTVKSVEVWANELRLQEFSNDGGWAAQASLNVQLSDLGSVSLQGHIERAGFGGIEQSVAERSNDDTREYTITTQVDLGKLLPPQARLNMPLYYSYARETVSPKYNPLDTDMLLSDALDAATTQHERDSITSLTTRKQVSRNLSLTGVRLNIATRKHPMPYDPANFTFNYSRTSTDNTGETTVYEHEQTWRAGMNYAWSPNWKAWEPFKALKSKSKWLEIVKAQNFSFAPQSIAFNTDIVRQYYEIQERDMDNLDAPTAIPVRWTPSFLWNRDFSLRWDFTRALHFSFQSATHAEIEEPYTPVNRALYPDRYEAWKDSVRHSILSWGTPLDYQQTAQLSYKLPLEKVPAFDWLSADGSYQATYSWRRGAELQDGSTLGNNINSQRTANISGKLNMELLYNHWAFLKEANRRFAASNVKSAARKNEQERKRAAAQRQREQQQAARARAEAERQAAAGDSTALKALANQAAQPQSNARGVSPQKGRSNGFASEVEVYPDSTIQLTHGQKSKRIRVTARTADGKPYRLRFRRVDENTIAIIGPKGVPASPAPAEVDTLAAAADSLSLAVADSVGQAEAPATLRLRINVQAKPKLEDENWYKWAQAGARFLMMVRNVSVSYRNTYALALPGFLPDVGDALGQRRLGGMMSPGLDFAFGLIGDGYIDRARDRGWLLSSDSVATPATTSTTADLQLKATLEPFPDFKIDLSASRTMNTAKSIQYMYAGSPTTQTGSFNITTISLRTAFTSRGNAANGYDSETFRRFQDYLGIFRDRVEQRYAGTTYPAGVGHTGTFDPANGTVDTYSADVMVPAFLAAYTGHNPHGASLDIFPGLMQMLPNWSVSYKGLSNLPFVRQHLKNLTLTHAYKSVYAVGSYNSYSSWVEYMHGDDRGYALNTTTGEYLPSSMFDISTVSINEAFSPLIGLNATFSNNMTAKIELRRTRVLTLSMTSAQINEASSNDIVIGWGYKINDFKFSSLYSSRSATQRAAAKSRARSGSARAASQESNSQTAAARTQTRGFAHDLNLRFDFSLRSQDAITRNIQTSLSEATTGNRAIKASFAADYTMSRYVTCSLYYDFQRSDPLLSSSSYPTITQDFGFNMKFMLTR